MSWQRLTVSTSVVCCRQRFIGKRYISVYIYTRIFSIHQGVNYIAVEMANPCRPLLTATRTTTETNRPCSQAELYRPARHRTGEVTKQKMKHGRMKTPLQHLMCVYVCSPLSYWHTLRGPLTQTCPHLYLCWCVVGGSGGFCARTVVLLLARRYHWAWETAKQLQEEALREETRPMYNDVSYGPPVWLSVTSTDLSNRINMYSPPHFVSSLFLFCFASSAQTNLKQECLLAF